MHLPSNFHANSYIICFTCSAHLLDYASKSNNSAETWDSKTSEVDNAWSGQEFPHTKVYIAECHQLPSALLITAIVCKLVKTSISNEGGLMEVQIPK